MLKLLFKHTFLCFFCAFQSLEQKENPLFHKFRASAAHVEDESLGSVWMLQMKSLCVRRQYVIYPFAIRCKTRSMRSYLTELSIWRLNKSRIISIIESNLKPSESRLACLMKQVLSARIDHQESIWLFFLCSSKYRLIYRPGLMSKTCPVKIKASGKWMAAFSSVSGRAFGRRSASEMRSRIKPSPYFCCDPRRGFMSFDPIIVHKKILSGFYRGRSGGSSRSQLCGNFPPEEPAAAP